MTSTKVQKLRTGIFIDGSNLHWAIRHLDPQNKWNIDFLKLLKHLRHHYRPAFVNYYTCVDMTPRTPEHKARALKHESFRKKLEGIGYSIITKPLKYLQGGKTKGDMDVEITVDIMNHLEDFDNIVLFSGDSDFLSLIKDCHASGKYVRIYAFRHNLSWELKKFAIDNVRCNYRLLEELKDELKYDSTAVPAVTIDT